MNAVITGLLIPFVGTSAGAACVLFFPAHNSSSLCQE